MRPDTRVAKATATPLLLLALLAAPPQALADISGTVVDATSADPIEGAVVGIRARPDIPTVHSAADGSYVLPPTGDEFGDGVIPEIYASVAYDHAAPVNYHNEAMQVFDGMTGVAIVLQRIPDTEPASYTPPSAGTCAGCHGNYFAQWMSSRHAGAAINPWVRDLFSGDGTAGGAAGYVFRDTHDPGETGFC